MSYEAQAQLEHDPIFNGRCFAVATQQAGTYKDDQRPDFVAVAQAVLRGDGEVLPCFTRLNAAGPGIADKVDNGDGTISQENVTDPDLLSLTQAEWPIVAGLYFAPDGTPLR